MLGVSPAANAVAPIRALPARKEEDGRDRLRVAAYCRVSTDSEEQELSYEGQAAVVRRIYRDFLDGFSVDRIAADLRREGVPGGAGKASWPPSTVRYILTNEKYAGALLLQKTMVEDFLTHRLVKNNGRLPQYYVEDSHPPVVPKAIFFRAGEELWLRSRETRARALRRQWRLMNLLPGEAPAVLNGPCGDEADFRARTARRLRSWDDDALVRVLEKVVPGGATTFKGGVEVKNGT